MVEGIWDGGQIAIRNLGGWRCTVSTNFEDYVVTYQKRMPSWSLEIRFEYPFTSYRSGPDADSAYPLRCCCWLSRRRVPQIFPSPCSSHYSDTYLRSVSAPSPPICYSSPIEFMIRYLLLSLPTSSSFSSLSYFSSSWHATQAQTITLSLLHHLHHHHHHHPAKPFSLHFPFFFLSPSPSFFCCFFLSLFPPPKTSKCPTFSANAFSVLCVKPAVNLLDTRFRCTRSAFLGRIVR